TLESTAMKSRVTFPIKWGIGVVAVPITADMSPNVFASVMVPTASGLVTAQKQLNVPPASKLVTVKITADKDEYRPGDKATFTIEARDSSGKPVRADVAIGIVDEALFALREDDTQALASVFYAPLWDSVTTVAPY